MERCYAQSNRLSRLLRDISVLTRMDEAANMIDMEKVDISMLVSNIVNEVSLTGTEANHRCQFPKTEDTVAGQLLSTLLHLPQSHGQRHRLS